MDKHSINDIPHNVQNITHIYIHRYNIHVYKQTDIHIYIYIYMYVCMYVCMYVRMFVYMYVCMYVCMYVYTYTQFKPSILHSMSYS